MKNVELEIDENNKLNINNINSSEMVEFLNFKTAKGISENLKNNKVAHILSFYTFLSNNNYDFKKVSKDVISEYANYLIAIKSEDSSLSKCIREANKNLTTIKQFFYFYDKKYDNGFFASVFYDDKLRMIDDSVFIIKTKMKNYNLLTPDTAKKIVDNFESWRDILIFKLMYLNGISLNDILKLTIKDVEDCEKYGKLYKSSGTKRVLTLTIRKDLLIELKEYITKERAWYGDKNDYLFVFQKNNIEEPVHCRNVRYEIEKINKKLNLNITLNDIKNSYYDYLIMYNEEPLYL